MPRNLDYPMPMHGRMVRQRLWEAQRDAAALYEALRDDDAVPAWTVDKVARGAENLHQVSNYLRFKVSNPISWGAAEVEEKKGLPTALKVAGVLALGVMALDLLASSSDSRRRR